MNKQMVMTGAQIGMSALGMVSAANNQKQQLANLRNQRAWELHYNEIDRQQQEMISRKRAREVLSEKRATAAARGVRLATGSTLLELTSTLDDLDEELFWINETAKREVMKTDMSYRRARSQLNAKYGESLMSSAKWAANTYMMYSMANPLSSWRHNVMSPASAGQTQLARAQPFPFRRIIQ